MILTNRIFPIVIIILTILIHASTVFAQKELQDIRKVAVPIELADAKAKISAARISPQGGGVIIPTQKVPALIQVSAANAGETREAILWIASEIPAVSVLFPVLIFANGSRWEQQPFQTSQDIRVGALYFLLGISNFGSFWQGNATIEVTFLIDGDVIDVRAPFQAYRGEVYRTTPIVTDLKTDNEVAVLGKFNKDLPATVVFDNLVIGSEALRVFAGKVVINTKKTPFFSLLPGPYLVTVCQNNYCGSGLVSCQLPTPHSDGQ